MERKRFMPLAATATLIFGALAFPVAAHADSGRCAASWMAVGSVSDAGAVITGGVAAAMMLGAPELVVGGMIVTMEFPAFAAEHLALDNALKSCK